jgi:Tfp pilus assembly protein PilZ
MISDRSAAQSVARDQRSSTRHPVFYRLDVVDAADKAIGYLVDISEGGMRVRCKPDIDVVRVEKLHVLLPRWMDLGDSLTVSGRFVWCKPFKGRSSEAGFVFEGLSLKVQTVLEALIGKIVDAAVEDGKA